MSKLYALAEVKSLGDDSGPGEFEVVLSAPTLDRDGEVIATRAFDPLPARITFDYDHGMSVATTIGSGVPSYDEAGRLVVRGSYASIPRAQEVRTLVREGHITTTSVAFMDAQREQKDGVSTITRAELLNGAFVAIPSNREAVVLSSKSYAERLPAGEGDRNVPRGLLEQIEEHAAKTGAVWSVSYPGLTKTDSAPETPAGDQPAGKSPASVVAQARSVAAQAAASLALS